MGKKKQRPSSSRRKPSQSSGVASTSEPPQPELSLDPVIFREGSQVQEEMKRGNYWKALTMVRKSMSSHQDSPHLLYLEAVALQFLAKTKGKDSGEMIGYLEDANESVEFALNSLPSSIHFASCKVAILYQKALLNDKDWGEAIRECKSALNLKIEDSTDPGVDMFLEENEKVKSSKESRIELEKGVIKWYLQLCEQEQNQIEKGNKESVEKVSGPLQEIMKEFEAEIMNWRAIKQVKTHYGMEKYYGVSKVKKEEYKSFWRTLSAEKKRDFCKVSIEELQRHWKLINFHLVGREAIDFAREHKTWKCWECCDCHKKFGYLELYRNHNRKVHWENLYWVELEYQIPGEVIEFIENGDWKPLDAEYWVTKIISKMNSESSISSDGDLFDKQSLDESVQDLFGSKSDENESPERAMILRSIRGMFRLFLLQRCLAKTYLYWAIQFTVQQFEDLIPFSRHLGLEAIQIICLLKAAELNQVREFLQNLTITSGKLINPKLVRPRDDNLSCVQVFDIKEKVRIGEILIHRLLDERFLSGDEISLTNNFDAINVLLIWSCEGANIPMVLKALPSLKDSQRQKSKEIFQIFLKECSQDEELCDYKLSMMTRITIKAIESVESMLPEKIEEGDASSEQSYFRIMKKRQKELEGKDDTESTMEKSLISNVIKDILAQAQKLAGLYDKGTESISLSEEDELKMLEDLESAKRLVRLTLQKKRVKSLEDLAYVMAKLWPDISGIMQHELKLERVSLFDYSSIMAYLLKSFLQAKVEQLKYDSTAAAALASEIDDSSEISTVCDNVIEKQDKKKKKSKNKNKKKKNSDRDKKSKATDCIEPEQLQHDETKQEDNPDSEIGASASVEDLQESILNESKLLDIRLEELRKIEKEFAEKRAQAVAENVEGLNPDSEEVLKTAEESELERTAKNEQEEVSETKVEADSPDEATKTAEELELERNVKNEQEEVSETKVEADSPDEATKTAEELELERNVKNEQEEVSETKVEADSPDEATKTAEELELERNVKNEQEEVSETKVEADSPDEATKTAEELEAERNVKNEQEEVSETKTEADSPDEVTKTAEELEAERNVMNEQEEVSENKMEADSPGEVTKTAEELEAERNVKNEQEEVSENKMKANSPDEVAKTAEELEAKRNVESEEEDSENQMEDLYWKYF